MDAKQACDKLNGFNFQNRYLVGECSILSISDMVQGSNRYTKTNGCLPPCLTVLYHQPEKMAKSKEDLAERQENLEKLKRQHGIE